MAKDDEPTEVVGSGEADELETLDVEDNHVVDSDIVEEQV